MYRHLKNNSIYIAWAASLIATLGSLYFSNVLHLPPCILCWYQRIGMYPLIVILGIAAIRKEYHVWRYALPLSVIGLLIAIYHNLLYYKILPESAAPCVQGISCTTQQLLWFGFLTIPLMSLIGFTIIVISLYILKKHDDDQRS
jgi:disulfide bond formation protein DsbB